ncbi:SLBB domain-containing protein [Massilia sp. DWR3-1-1]|uniref:polysaccharide biosynthesis/export family protein n=1 Tax=Massilia sp. DWR3-1-1 TaxID=2804559 RepID=UPI003CE75B37
MRKIFGCLIAAATITGCFTAQAQEVGGRSESFGQPVTLPGEAATVSEARPARTVIRNSASDTSAGLDTVGAGRSSVGDSEVAARLARSARPPQANEFQKFLVESTGRSVPLFGGEFFSNAPSTFAPVMNAPVPSDYPLGPGDELLIRGWGSIDIDFRAKIDRNGAISIPTVGTVLLAGVKAGDAESVVRGAIGRLYKGVTVNVNFGQLRAITIYVVGQAIRPGTYTVSSLSTLVTALFSSGGPNANGSMRRVQVKRAGKVVAELDLYAFIAKGDKSSDIKLQDGDSIYIPSAAGYVAVIGKIGSPAVYELRGGNDTIESLLDIAGGLPVVADPRRAFLERIDPSTNRPRSVEQFALEGAGLKRTLKSGDVLNITSITPEFSNAVILRGNVDQPIRAPFKNGMRVSDLIPSRDYLVTRNSISHRNNAANTNTPLGFSANAVAADGTPTSVLRPPAVEVNESIAARIGRTVDEINWEYAVVERQNRTDLSVSLIPFNLGNVFANPSGMDNIVLQPGDTVTIFSQQDVMVPMDRRKVFVRVEGEVNVPGVYQMNSGETLQALLARAGGATTNAYLFGVAFYRDQVRKEQEANLEKAAIRMESQIQSEQSRILANTRNSADAALLEVQRQADLQAAKETVSRFRRLKPSGRIALGLETKERSFARLPALKLESGDRLIIPARPEFVHVFGSVNAESSPLWRANSRVSDYLKFAGLAPGADRDNVFIMRVDGSVVSSDSGGWFMGRIGGVEVMPGDSIIVPEKVDKETKWSKFMQGTREWAQIFANFGLGAAAIKTLRN